jgi:ribose 5-phosphate isomerase B
MKIIIGSDHAGYSIKEMLKTFLISHGHDVEDMGPSNEDSCDYPDFAVSVAASVLSRRENRGILVCGTGIGMCITANKCKGIRAALCHNIETARMSRAHNNANILCLGARVLNVDRIREIVMAWLETPFEEGRHARRLEKIQKLEDRKG